MRIATKTLNFRQAGEFYRSLSKAEQTRLVSNLSGDLSTVTNDVIRTTMLSYFYKADADYGTALAKATKDNQGRVQQMAASLSD